MSAGEQLFAALFSRLWFLFTAEMFILSFIVLGEQLVGIFEAGQGDCTICTLTTAMALQDFLKSDGLSFWSVFVHGLCWKSQRESEVTVDLLPVFFFSALSSSSLLYRVVEEVCPEVTDNWKYSCGVPHVEWPLHRWGSTDTCQLGLNLLYNWLLKEQVFF